MTQPDGRRYEGDLNDDKSKVKGSILGMMVDATRESTKMANVMAQASIHGLMETTREIGKMVLNMGMGL